MVELTIAPALDGLGLPLAVGAVRLNALPPVRRTLVAPFAGAGISGLPAPGQLAVVQGGRIVWAGFGQWFFEGDALLPDQGAALTDQTDGWLGFALAGPDARSVLARLVPIDLDPDVFPPGSVARTLLRHVMLLLIVTDDGVELMVPRSYAHTAMRDLAEAMRAVAGRVTLTQGREGL